MSTTPSRPHGLLYNHDAEDPDALAYLGETDKGEEVEINKRAAESDLLVYVNINLVSMDGGWKSTATGLASYRSLRHHHNVQTMRQSRSFMDRHKSELHSSNWRMGEVLRNSGVKVFQIETTLNNDTFGTSGPMSVLQKREWEWTARDRATFIAMKAGLDRMPMKARRKIFNSWLAPYGITSVQAGEVEAVHEATTENVFAQQLVPIEGQADVLTMGLPYICPYNVNSVMNPILVMCLGLGYFFNMYRGQPLVREGGVVIMSHPTPWEFHPVHHPSYIDFFEQVLAETTDPVEIEARFEKQYAEDEWYRHLYRTSYAYHGVHPFYMWYWGCHGMAHVGKVIIVGRRAAVGATARVHARLHAAGRPRDGHRRRRSRIRPSRTCTTRRSSWRTSRDRWLKVPATCRASRAPASRTRPRTVPDTVDALPPEARLGADYETDWARRFPARGGVVLLEGVMRPAVAALGAPERAGIDRLAGLSDGPVIFAPNHHSHLDTPTMLTSIPEPWRHKVFVAAAADYFFKTHVTAAASALALGAIPMDRSRVSRRTADQAAELIEQGWSMLIFPEGGRSPDGWGQPFRGGAAYLSNRCGVPVVPVHLEGTGKILRKGAKRPTPSHVRVTFGTPLARGGRREHHPLRGAHRAGGRRAG